jgi:transcriptional regulator with XRE-family HTH domain
MPKETGRDQQFDKRIGLVIRQVRKANRQTQRDLANELGITYQQIQKYEDGMNSIPASRIPRLCSVLEISPNHLFEWNEKLPLLEPIEIEEVDCGPSAFDYKLRPARTYQTVVRDWQPIDYSMGLVDHIVPKSQGLRRL